MNTTLIPFAVTAAVLSTSVFAADTLDADAVRDLISGNTVHTITQSGKSQKNYFSPDGKTIRQIGNKTIEGTWFVKDDGSQCVGGMQGGCAKITQNEDGTYSRVGSDGTERAKWTTIVNGKDI